MKTLRFTEAEYARRMVKNTGRDVADKSGISAQQVESMAIASIPGATPGAAHPKRRMNKTEAAWAEVIEERKRQGFVLWYRFEGMRLRLADGTYYTPDFPVLTDRGLEFHEVKGFMREAARVRLRVAAELYPFRFFLIRRSRVGGWDISEVPGFVFP